MSQKTRLAADELTLKAGVLLMHAEAARAAEARRAAREARGIVPVAASESDVRQRIVKRRVSREAAIIAASARPPRLETLETRPTVRKPSRRQHVIPEELYSNREYERLFGHEKPLRQAEGEPAPISVKPGDDDDGAPF